MFTHLIYGKSKNNMSIRFVLSNLIAKAVWTARSMSGANKKMIGKASLRILLGEIGIGYGNMSEKSRHFYECPGICLMKECREIFF